MYVREINPVLIYNKINMFGDISTDYVAPHIHLNRDPQRNQSLAYEMQVKNMIESIVHQGKEIQVKRLTRILYRFIETLQNDRSVNPRFVELLDDTITSHPRFQSMLFDIMLECSKDGWIEEFLRLSTEYSMIFHIRGAILENEDIQALIRERLGFMEANKQHSTIHILQSYLKQ